MKISLLNLTVILSFLFTLAARADLNCINGATVDLNSANAVCQSQHKSGSNEFAQCISDSSDAYSAALEACDAELPAPLKRGYNELCDPGGDECASGLTCQFAAWEGATSACLP